MGLIMRLFMLCLVLILLLVVLITGCTMNEKNSNESCYISCEKCENLKVSCDQNNDEQKTKVLPPGAKID